MRVVKRRTGAVPEDVVIVLEDDTHCVLPLWMLDEEVCASMKEARTQAISLAALRGLRRLLDSQCTVVHTPADGRSHAREGESSDEGSEDATTPATGKKRTLGTVANRDSETMPEHCRSALASSCHGGENQQGTKR